MKRGLSDIRVVDFSSGIAGSYATKLFADAGADVIKVEPPEGDLLRGWCATGIDLGGQDGALFQFLHHNKRSVIGRSGEHEIDELVATADLVVDTGVPPMVEASTLRSRHPQLVVLSVTPYGRTGPYASRPASELTVQADSGGVAMRGRRPRPPVMAGGRVAEWVTGAFAAAAAATSVWEARRSGVGDHLDVSMAEVFNLASTLFVDLTCDIMGLSHEGPPSRAVETPSIEPTQDGWVGFNTNSPQQFEDFLVLIERPDLLGDEVLSRIDGRTGHLDEWEPIVRAWTTRHTTSEIVTKATELRIPVAPVGNAAVVLDFPHFQARGVFVDDPTALFKMPRRPWRLNDADPPPARPSPRLGEHTGRIGPRPAAARRTLPDRQSLADMRILDLTAWWAGPVVANFFGSLGADVIKVESPRRLDGMRLLGGAGHPEWWERSSFYLSPNTNKRSLGLDLSTSEGRDVALRLIGQCDIVVENFSPRVMANLGLTWDVVRATNPRAIMVRMPAFGLTGPWQNNVGFAQTMEQLTGLAWVTGHPDDQPIIQRGPCDPNAGMHAVFAIVVALAEREATGRGQHLEVPMIETALNAAAEQVVEYSAYGNLLSRDGNRAPSGAPQNLYACRGVEQWLAVAVETDQQWEGLRAALGQPSWSDDPALKTHAGRRTAHDMLDEQLSEWAAVQELDDAVAHLIAHGVPAASVVDPRLSQSHPQFRARNWFEEVDHPIAGRRKIRGLPFRSERFDRWIGGAAPTLGQHNREILSHLLALTDDQIDRLEAEGVIGTRPSGV